MGASLTKEIRQKYFDLFNSCISAADCNTTISKIISNKARYKSVSLKTAVPWYVIALIHTMESSGSFSRHLHNGDPLTARTVQVPAGRPKTGEPPFTWEQSAVDALNMKLPYNDWSLEGILFFLEKYNGWGYQNKGVNSPYLWGKSNHHSKGKFVKDGVYDPNAPTSQIGAAVLLKELYKKFEIELQSSIKKDWGEDPSFDNPEDPGKKKEQLVGFDNFIEQMQKVFKIYSNKL